MCVNPSKIILTSGWYIRCTALYCVMYMYNYRCLNYTPPDGFQLKPAVHWFSAIEVNVDTLSWLTDDVSACIPQIPAQTETTASKYVCRRDKLL